MTVTASTSKLSYSGNGSTTAFAYSRYFLDDDDLRVTLVDADDVETVQTITTHYTVSGAGSPSGGTVTMVTAPASGETLVIERRPEISQGIDYTDNDPFPADVMEEGLDRLTMIAQMLSVDLGRAVLAPLTYSGSATIPFAAGNASKYLTFDGTGLGLEAATTVSGISVTGTQANDTAILADASGLSFGKLDFDRFADGDYGDISIASGVVTIDSGAIDYDTLAAALLSGSDTSLITGTVGTAGHVAYANADGDLVTADAGPYLVTEAESSGNISIDLSAAPMTRQGQIHKITLTGGGTLNAIANGAEGQVFQTHVTFTAGTESLSLNASVFDIGGRTYTANTVAGAVDILTWVMVSSTVARLIGVSQDA